MRSRRHGLRMCKRLSAFIRRSEAAGCRSRWKLPMHGEFSKQLLAEARGSTRRTMAVGIVLLVVAAALYYVFGNPAGKQPRSNRFGAEGPVPVHVTPVTRADIPVCLD